MGPSFVTPDGGLSDLVDPLHETVDLTELQAAKDNSRTNARNVFADYPMFSTGEARRDEPEGLPAFYPSIEPNPLTAA